MIPRERSSQKTRLDRDQIRGRAGVALDPEQ